MRPMFKLLFALLILATAGCAVQPRAPGQTFDRIGEEMQGAVGSRSKGTDDALGQAMLPPL